MEPLRLTMPPAGSEIRVAPEAGRPFALAFSPLGMRFERGGSNLYISGPDDAHLVINGYFAYSELAPFCTEDGNLLAGADFLMIMNPSMNLSIQDASAGRPSFFSLPDKVWDDGVFGTLPAGGDIPDYGLHEEWGEVANYSLAPPDVSGMPAPGAHDEWAGGYPPAPENEAGDTGKEIVRNRIGLDGSISVLLLTPPGAALNPFLTYVALNNENYCIANENESENENSLFQDGPMGQACATLYRDSAGDTLVLAADGFYAFQAYYGGWLSLVFISMQVEGIEILMQNPSSQSVVNLQEYFSNAVFSDVPIAWSYDESPKVAANLSEFSDEGFNLVDLIDALGPEHVALPDLRILSNEAIPPPPHVENIVLVRADTNEAVTLSEDWPGEIAAADSGYKSFTLDEQTLLLLAEEAAGDTSSEENPAVEKQPEK